MAVVWACDAVHALPHAPQTRCDRSTAFAVFGLRGLSASIWTFVIWTCRVLLCVNARVENAPYQVVVQCYVLASSATPRSRYKGPNRVTSTPARGGSLTMLKAHTANIKPADQMALTITLLALRT